MEFQKVFISDKASLTKKQARASMEGKWGKMFIASLVLLICLPILPISGPIIYGMSGILIRNSRGQEWKISDIFSGFSQYGRSMKLFIWLFLEMVVASAPLIIYLFIAGKYFFPRWLEGFSAGMLWEFPVFIIGALLFIYAFPMFFFTRISQTFFLLVDFEEMVKNTAMAGSVNLMKWNDKKLLFLFLSFCGWLILEVILMTAILASIVLIGGTAVKVLIIILLILAIIAVACFASSYALASLAVFYEKLTTRIPQKDPKVIFEETIVL